MSSTTVATEMPSSLYENEDQQHAVDPSTGSSSGKKSRSSKSNRNGTTSSKKRSSSSKSNKKSSSSSGKSKSTTSNNKASSGKSSSSSGSSDSKKQKQQQSAKDRATAIIKTGGVGGVGVGSSSSMSSHEALRKKKDKVRESKTAAAIHYRGVNMATLQKQRQEVVFWKEMLAKLEQHVADGTLKKLLAKTKIKIRNATASTVKLSNLDKRLRALVKNTPVNIQKKLKDVSLSAKDDIQIFLDDITQSFNMLDNNEEAERQFALMDQEDVKYEEEEKSEQQQDKTATSEGNDNEDHLPTSLSSSSAAAAGEEEVIEENDEVEEEDDGEEVVEI